MTKLTLFLEKHKEENTTLGSEILMSVKVGENEWKVLLGLVDSGSSKSLAKKSAVENVTDSEMQKSETAKWKTNAGVFATESKANIENAKLPQFTKHKEFDMNKVCVFEDENEKHDTILGREVCQNIGLDTLNSTKQFKWHGHLIHMVPSGH